MNKNLDDLIRFLENREILLKQITRKISQKGGLPNFPAPLTRVGLPLMKLLLSFFSYHRNSSSVSSRCSHSGQKLCFRKNTMKK